MEESILKFKYCLAIPFLALLSACAAGTPNESPNDPSSSSSLEESESIVSQPELPELSDVEYDLSISTEGFINDFLVGTPAISGKDYKLAFGFSSANLAGAVVKTDVASVAEAELRGEYWYLLAKNPGKTHLIIEDAEGIIHLRKVIEVKKELNDKELDQALYEVDHWQVDEMWQSFCGNFSVAFFDDLSASMAGKESGGASLEGVTFTLERDDTVFSEGGSYDSRYWAGYSVKNWPIADFVLTSVILYRSGDILHMHTRNALLGILVPGEAQ
ncbi:MAG: hypothetical protein SPI58_01765 [Candidatus Enteromonas sp.]|nr:hypothetical protein [Candidatus Enteromonas sp.]